MDSFTSSKLTGGSSSPGLYLVSCNLQGATPAKAVVKLEVDSQEHPFFDFYQVLTFVLMGLYHSSCRLLLPVLAPTRAGLPGMESIALDDSYFLARQVGESGLGPLVLYVEQDKSSPYWGLMVMEALQDGGFGEPFS